MFQCFTSKGGYIGKRGFWRAGCCGGFGRRGHVLTRLGAERRGGEVAFMTPRPIAVLQKAADLGLELGSEGRHTLTVEPATRCPRAFADTLKDHKWLLLDLLR